MNLHSNMGGDGYYYDLQGRRYTQRPGSKGVYIKNGKKVAF